MTSAPVVAMAPAIVAANAGPAGAWTASIPISGPSVPELAAFDSVMVGLLQRWSVAGGQCAVAKDGRLVYARGFGYVDTLKSAPVSPTARFRIASSTKPFTAVAILRLMQHGRLRLDDRAFDILDTFTPPAGTAPDSRLRAITVRELLEHSAGFPWPTGGFDPQFDGLRIAADSFRHPYPATSTDIIRWVMGQPLGFAPGSSYNYSNVGYNILGRIIERLTRLPYAAALKALVLDPAGVRRFELLTRTSPSARLFDEVFYDDGAVQLGGYAIYDDDPMVRPYSYGGFDGRAIDAHGGGIANAPDLTRFLNAVGGSTGAQLLSTDTLKTMLAKPANPFWAGKPKWYGMGWDVNPPNKVIMSHAGAITFGTVSCIFRLHDGITFAAVFNHLDTNVTTMGLDIEDRLTAAAYSVTHWPSADLNATIG